jgi:gluconokinase
MALARAGGGVDPCADGRRPPRHRGPSVVFVYLAGSRELIARRVAARQGHFMPAALLDSQFAAVEPPGPDERAITVEVTGSPSAEAVQILQTLNLEAAAGQ